jgi:hypothetical protein
VKKDPNRYPPGWDAKKVRKVVDFYDNLSEDEEAEEDERIFSGKGQVYVGVPKALLSKVRQLIDAHRRKAAAT